MAFNWDDFKGLAKALANQAPPTQAQLRSAISRGYYAVFGQAMDVGLNRRRWIFPSGQNSKHAWLIGQYNQGSVDDQRFAQSLRTLRDHRNDADYDGNKTYQQAAVARLMGNVDHCLTLLDKIR